MKKIIIAIFFLYPAFLYSAGNSSLDILKQDFSPRAIALGGSYAAIGDDVYSIYYNPASITDIKSTELGFSHSSGFEATSINYLGYAMPLPYLGLAKLDKGVMGFYFYTTSLGDFTYRHIENDGSVSINNLNAERNNIFSLTYGEKISVSETQLESKKLFLENYAALSIKYVSSNLLETYSAKTFAFDIGYKLKESNYNLIFGLSLLNIGGKLKYISESYDLPQTLKASLCYKTYPASGLNINYALEYDKFTNDKENSINMGFELWIKKALYLMGGYRSMKDNKGPSFGIGFAVSNFKLDFSSSFLSVYDYSAFSFSYKFNPVFYEKNEVIKSEEKTIKEKPKKTVVQDKKEDKPKPKSKDNDWLLLY